MRSDARVSSLTLKYVKYTDAGRYLCTARSTIGEDAQSAHLEVRCKYFLLKLSARFYKICLKHFKGFVVLNCTAKQFFEVL